MSSQGLSIAISADTTGLAQGFAAATAQTKAFADSVNAAAAQMTALSREQTRAAQEEDRKRLESWKSVTGAIYSAESSLAADIFAKRQNLTLDLIRIGEKLIESEIANDLKYYTSHLIYNALGLESDKSAQQGGLLVHLLGESQKTAATVAGVAARTAVEGAGAAAGKAAQLVANRSTIQGDAATAASGTWSAVAQIPIVGPFLAPVAAAGAYAAVMAFGSFEKGAWELPYDMLANVHKGETILNASEASDFRSFVGAAGKDAGGDVHLHYAPTVQSEEPQSLDDMLREQSSSMLNWVQARMRDGSLKAMP